MSAAGPTRRAVLAGGGVLLATGCLPGEDAPPPSAREPEGRLRARIAAEVAALAALYDSVLDAFPAARDELSPLAAEHGAHVEALLGPPAARSSSSSATASPSLMASQSSSAEAVAPAVPSTVVAARSMLVKAETRAARRRARLARGVRPELARLFASIAACNAAHAALLRRGAP